MKRCVLGKGRKKLEESADLGINHLGEWAIMIFFSVIGVRKDFGALAQVDSGLSLTLLNKPLLNFVTISVCPFELWRRVGLVGRGEGHRIGYQVAVLQYRSNHTPNSLVDCAK